MKKKRSFIIAFIVCITLSIALGETVATPSRAAEPPPFTDAHISTNLLLNGSMEEQPFYWKKPNHFVAVHWYRWWIHGTVIPEYDDTRTTRPHYDGEHAQTYFKWGAIYTAGLYQVVYDLTPCTLYQLSAWSRNDSLDDVLPHAKVGLAPEGTPLTKNIDSGGVTDGFPPRTVWSAEQTALFTWEQLSVVAESTGEAMTVILYAAPRPSDDRTHYYDSFWDAASLVQVPFPGNRLPEPKTWTSSGFMSNVNTNLDGDQIIIEWDTESLASTQVWYDIKPKTEAMTSTTPISYTNYPPLRTAYIPSVAKNPKHPSIYTATTALDTTPLTHHQAVIPNVEDGDTVRFVLLSRRPLDGQCVTEIYGPITFVVNTTSTTSQTPLIPSYSTRNGDLALAPFR